jgi:hypothetical protein
MTATSSALTTNSTGQEGALQIIAAAAYPNPNPSAVMLNLAGPADTCSVTLYSKGMTQLATFEVPGRDNPGWLRVELTLSGLANGLYYYSAVAKRGGLNSAPATVGKLFVLR